MNRRWVAVAVAAAFLASCSGSGDIEVKDGWARESPTADSAGAVYLTVVGGDDADELTGVAVAEGFSVSAELHQSSMADDGEEAGMMMMHPVATIEVPPGSEVRLEPGGYHVMLIGLSSPLELGDEFPLTLEFARAGRIVVTVTVEDR